MKKKDVMMISLWLKNQNSIGETYGAILHIIRRMQSGEDLRSEVNVKKKEEIDITTGSLKKILGWIPN